MRIIAVYLKAGEFIIAHPEEFFKPSYVKDTLDVVTSKYWVGPVETGSRAGIRSPRVR